jgi:hypothetical protein
MVIRTLAADMPNEYPLSRTTGARWDLTHNCDIHDPSLSRDPVFSVRFPFGCFVGSPLNSVVGINRELLIHMLIHMLIHIVAKVQISLIRNLATSAKPTEALQRHIVHRHGIAI